MNNRKPRLLRITTVPMSLRYLISGQMKFMASNGMEVLMASSDGIHLEEALKYEQVEHAILDFKRDIAILHDIKSLFGAISLIRRFKPDIVHTHTPKAGLIGMIAAKICGVPIRIHTVAGMPMEGLSV